MPVSAVYRMRCPAIVTVLVMRTGLLAASGTVAILALVSSSLLSLASAFFSGAGAGFSDGSAERAVTQARSNAPRQDNQQTRVSFSMSNRWERAFNQQAKFS